MKMFFAVAAAVAVGLALYAVGKWGLEKASTAVSK